MEQLEGNEFWESVPELLLKPSLRDSIHKGMTNLLTEQLQPPETLKDLHRVHLLSLPESQQLLSWINSCLSRVPERFHELNRQFEESSRRLQEVETVLGRIPSDEILEPLMHDLSNLYHRLGGLQKQVERRGGKYSIPTASLQ